MKKIKKHLKGITISIILILIFSLILIKYSLLKEKEENVVVNELEITKQENEEKESIEKEGLTELAVKNIYVDIKGAVKNPGVYEIREDKKVIDVIDLAGGLTKNADTSLINLAMKVSNEMVIRIYTKEEVKDAIKEEPIIKVIEKECNCPELKNDACLKQEGSTEEEKGEDTNNNEIGTSKININTASLEELQRVSGIGESKAKAIIEHRNEFGEFKKIEDIMEVSGIGEALYEKIKDSITI